MPGPLRRSRLLALLLLLLTPGLGGWAVQALHPCPAAAPAASADGPRHEQGHGHVPGHSGHESECHCIGSCQLTAAVRSGDAPTVDAAIPAFELVRPRPHVAHLLPAGRTPEHHPPATAPPVLS